ncbi:MAG TPA: TonB family protein [Candidatus Omnitrophota bacterium]|nr:energy transducer TonB [Candidatus Omnitrophota bacterium]HOX09421.1 TonB family protein [Candidatus Omnitrophota bacterium]HRZ67695.1 TonB family protein [Candidatus Omnitrophota bacterium]
MQEIRDTAGKYSYDAGKLTARGVIAVAAAVSVLWHILLLSTFKISVKPGGPEAAGQYPRVAFVGSILEDKTMVHYDAGEKSENIRKLAALAVPSENAYGPGANDRMPLSTRADPAKKTGPGAPSSSVTGERVMARQPFDKVMVRYKTSPSEIEGPARFREVVYKPELPTFLRWDESLGVDLQGLGDSFEVGLRFSVSPEGKVESVERVSSSGHPTVDIVAIRYLKGWQFAPLKTGADGGKQLGTIKLNLKLEKAAAK